MDEAEESTLGETPLPEPARKGSAEIVVGVDGSEASIAALREGVRLATVFHSPLRAVIAWQFPPIMGGYLPDDWSPDADAQLILDDAVQTVFGENVPGWFSGTIREGQPARLLIEESAGAQMLIVGSRGHGGFAGLLLGSVSAACAEHAKCPVLVLH
jgi:nucleotide-binding universal stress UspA family protein